MLGFTGLLCPNRKMLLRNQQVLVLLHVFASLHFMITAKRDQQPLWGTVRWGMPSVGSWRALVGSACVLEQWEVGMQ